MSDNFVDHLYDPYDMSPDGDWHAEDGLGAVPRLVVDRLVEAVVGVHVSHVEGHPTLGNVASNANTNRKPETNRSWIIILDRKALLSHPLTANSAISRTITHHTPSVFPTDQRGMRAFFIWTQGPEFRGHSCPRGGPQHQQGQGLILEHI